MPKKRRPFFPDLSPVKNPAAPQRTRRVFRPVSARLSVHHGGDVFDIRLRPVGLDPDVQRAG